MTRRHFGLTGTLVAFLALAMLGAQMAAYVSTSNLLEIVVHQGQVDKAKTVGSVLDAFFAERTGRLSDATKLLTARERVAASVAAGAGAPELATILGQTWDSIGLDTLEVIGRGEIVLYRAHEPVRRGDRATGWGVAEALAGKGLLVTARDRRGMSIKAIEPLRHDGKIVGAVATGLRVDTAFMESLAEETSAALVLLNRQGTVTVSRRGITITVDPTAVDEAYFQKIPVFRADPTARTTTVYMPLLIIDEAHVLVAQVGSERAYALLAATTRGSATASGVILAVSVLGGVGVLTFLMRPLRRLRARAEQTAIDITGIPIAPGRGGEIESVVHALDVLTDRLVARNHELAEAAAVAQAASRAKSDFLSRMSHEIRTPLNGVLGMAELLQRTPLDDTQHRYCRTIASSGRALHELLSDILDVAKIEAGKLQVEMTALEPLALATDIADAYRELASARGLVLAAELDASVPARLVGDPARLRQVLTNLLGNALKFTPPGGSITFGMSRLDPPPAPGGHWLRFTVRDTGIGMAAETLSKLFAPFTQGDPGINRNYGGTGLGLVICRGLVDLMGGALHLDSAAGQGTTARVDLPFEAAPAPARASADVDGGRREGVAARVLVAEDNPVNQEVIGAMLTDIGATVTIVEDGARAVQALQDARFDIVLMDCQMPVMDGYEATAAIRAAEAGSRRMPIVALTANAFAEDRARCLEAGMDDYISKPVTTESLRRAVARWTAGHGPERDGSLVSPAGAPRP